MQGLETNQAWRTCCCVHGMSFKNRCISAGDGAPAVAFLCIRLVPSALHLQKSSIAEEWKGETAEELSWLFVIQLPPGKPWVYSGRKHCISLFYSIVFFKGRETEQCSQGAEMLFSVALPGSGGWYFLLKLFLVKWVGWVAPKMLVCCRRDGTGSCATALSRNSYLYAAPLISS